MRDVRSLLLAKGWGRHTFISTCEAGIEKLLSAIPDKLHAELKTPNVKVLLATYDCAVVHNSFDDEPWLQIFIAVPTKYDKKYANGRDSRRMHFSLELSDGSSEYEINARGICQIERELLIDLERDEDVSILPANAFDLKNWMSERFRQDTWPDAFNSSVRRAEKRLKSFWKRYKDFISGLYIQLNTNEELVSGKYRASIIVCVEAGKMRSLIKFLREKDKVLVDKNVPTVLNKVANEIKIAFGDSIDYEVDSTSHSGYAIEVIDEESITLAQLREFPRFSPYSLSLYDSNSSLPVEMVPGRATDL